MHRYLILVHDSDLKAYNKRMGLYVIFDRHGNMLTTMEKIEWHPPSILHILYILFASQLTLKHRKFEVEEDTWFDCDHQSFGKN